MKKLPAKMYPGFGFSMLDRAVKEFFAARCTKADLAVLAQHFGRDGALHCIYCESAAPNRWDHLYPVSKGGDSSPGNLVPACSRCDDSKQDRTLEEWAQSKSEHRPKPEKLDSIRERISMYRTEFVYEEKEFEKKLSADQFQKYLRFRSKLDGLREQMRADGLIT